MSSIDSPIPLGLRSLPRKQIIITFAGVLLSMFLGSLDQTVVGTAMPRIISDLGGFSQYTWVTSVYVISSAVVVPITGKLTDMYGRKLFFLAGLALFVVTSFLCGLSGTITQLIIARGVQGIGAGIMMANAFTAIGDLFPPAERGKYQGFMSGTFGLSSVLGPTLGGFVTDTLSWHWVFFINIPLGLAVIALLAAFFPNFRPDNHRHRVDYAGLVTLALTVVPAMLALSWGGTEYPWGSGIIIGMFAFTVVMLIVFLTVESRAAEPIIPLSLFRNRSVIVAEIVVFFTGFGMFGGITFVPLFFQGVLGATATASGSFLTPMMLGMVTGSFTSGQLLSRTGGHYRLQGIGGLAIMALGLASLSRMTPDTGFGIAVANIVATGFGLGITMPLYTIAVQNAVPYRVLGVATSTTAFFRSIGGSVGLAVFGSVMTNRFAATFDSALPPAIKAAVPAEQLASMAHNPQALISPQAQEQLRGLFGQLGPQGEALFETLLQAMRDSLSHALSQVFLLGLFLVLVAFVVNLFIKEVPLRREHTHETTPADVRHREHM